jgi:flagellar M-ring protein FliF
MLRETGGFSGLWAGLNAGGRVALVAGGLLIVLLAAAGVIWSLEPDYRVLFANLSDSDAAAIVTALKHSKTAYRLTDGGTTIRVPADRVYETRLALMSSGAPLSGGVGFEIFDKQELGATEQSQKVSYQRALQGELARTIGALDHVRQARVLLALPESSVFRRDRQEARAAVSLILQHGSTLERDQIAGIQRLVAASVAGLDPARVVVTDQRGVTLSGPDALEGPGGVGAGRLGMKRDIEEYFTHKIADLLEGAYGSGQVIVSVDVTLNFDEIHRTVQDLLPPPASGATGEPGVRRKRQVVTGNASSDAATNTALNESSSPRTTSSSTDVEYEYGRRVEQVIAAPGSIEQISVGVVVRGQLTPEKQERIAQLVRMAAGLNERRGDAVTVQALEGVAAHYPATAMISTDALPPEPTITTAAKPPRTLTAPSMGLGAVVAAALALFATMAALAARRRRQDGPRALTSDERATLLQELEQAVAVPVASTKRRVS